MSSGIVVVDKPAGWTSHQVVGRARRLFGIRKIGHAGTLDPMATGVLILGVGRATRLLGHLALHDKAYTATIRLGESTTTDDAEGETTGRADASGVALDAVVAEMGKATGEIWQRPSSVSAIKVNGQRAYALARKGEAVELPARPVKVSRFGLVASRVGEGVLDLDVEVECSSGTYVRALARDLGAALGVGGHLTALRRTRIGRYTLSEAHELGDGAPPLMSMAAAAELSFPCVRVGDHEASGVGFGRALDLVVPGDPTGIIGPGGDLIALYRPGDGRAVPVAVLTSPA